jgi:hypothetical protein
MHFSCSANGAHLFRTASEAIKKSETGSKIDCVKRSTPISPESRANRKYGRDAHFSELIRTVEPGYLPVSRLHAQNPVSRRKRVRGLPCAKSERVRFHDIDLHIGKTRFLEALWKCVWIDYHHCVEEVKQAK